MRDGNRGEFSLEVGATREPESEAAIRIFPGTQTEPLNDEPFRESLTRRARRVVLHVEVLPEGVEDFRIEIATSLGSETSETVTRQCEADECR